MPGIAYLNTVSDYIHKHGMIHHDINLENVLVGQEVSLYMVDFGYSHSWTPGELKEASKNWDPPIMQHTRVGCGFPTSLFSEAQHRTYQFKNDVRPALRIQRNEPLPSKYCGMESRSKSCGRKKDTSENEPALFNLSFGMDVKLECDQLGRKIDPWAE